MKKKTPISHSVITLQAGKTNDTAVKVCVNCIIIVLLDFKTYFNKIINEQRLTTEMFS